MNDRPKVPAGADTAVYWDKHRAIIRRLFHPVTEALIDEARIAPGDVVLDVATGSGEPALSIAEVVGATGLVVGIDPLSAMIATAERAAIDRNVSDSARFQVASADRVPFEADRFDAVVSRFGIMFFSSPVECVHELLRVLKPNRPIVFAVWGYLQRNPFHHVMANVVDRYFPPALSPPDAPEPFRYAKPGKLLSVLDAAGAAQTSERLFKFNIEVPFGGEDFWTLRLDMAEKLRAKLSSLSGEQAAEIKREVFENVAPYSSGDGISFPAEALIVSATKLS